MKSLLETIRTRHSVVTVPNNGNIPLSKVQDHSSTDGSVYRLIVGMKCRAEEEIEKQNTCQFYRLG